MLIRHLLKQSNKKTRNHFKKSNRRKQRGGGFLSNIELPRIGGQSQIFGYSQCCPPLFQGGKMAYTADGNRMCGGSRKINKKSNRKLNRKSKSRKHKATKK